MGHVATCDGHRSEIHSSGGRYNIHPLYFASLSHSLSSLLIALGAVLQPRWLHDGRKSFFLPIILPGHVAYRFASQTYFTVRVKQARLQAEKAKKAKDEEKEGKSN